MNMMGFIAFLSLSIAAAAVTTSRKMPKQKCEWWAFECSTGDCINKRQFCDGHVDCPDGSDEIITTGTSACKNALINVTLTCKLPEKNYCDGIFDCDDKKDEFHGRCKIKNKQGYKMQCDRRGHCLNKLILNCSDRADWTCSENIGCRGDVCTLRGGGSRIIDMSKECETIPIFRCNSGECLTSEKFCDGIIDCSDGSDEIIMNATTVNNDGVSCSNRWNVKNLQCLLPNRFICDGIDHCDDRVDECQLGCGRSYFCKSGKCLHGKNTTPYECNGKNDCGDSSDEQNCIDGYLFKCMDGKALAMELFCNGRKDCDDGSDEILEQSGNGTDFRCSNKHNPSNLTCVLPRHHVCDNAKHCLHSEDEKHCDDSASPWHKCVNGNLIHKGTQVCNFVDNCGDSSDECKFSECNTTFLCPNSNKCLAFSRFCDGIDDCGDGSDEIISLNDELACNNKHNGVNRSCVLPEQYICNGMDHCKDRTDECGPHCPVSFMCNNGQCIQRENFCDGISHCEDSSDEIMSTVGFKCIVKYGSDDVRRSCVIPQRNLFDTTFDCADQSDDCHEKNSTNCFRCLTMQYFISSKQVCDGIIDCPDFSDECTCTTQNKKISRICDNYCRISDHTGCDNCQKDDVVCDDTKCIARNMVCDGIKQCNDGSDEDACAGQEQTDSILQDMDTQLDCNPASNVAVKKCNGIPECIGFEDECATVSDEIDYQISNVTDYSLFKCGNKTPSFCTSLFDPVVQWYHCPNQPHINLHTDNICDGIEDCDKQDENQLSIDEQGCHNRVKCNKSRPIEVGKSTIDKSKLCDMEIDCLEEEDEAPELCKGKGQPRFYCETRTNSDNATLKLGKLFIPKHQVMNGWKDCADNSDECPTEVFDDNMFSSQHDMIQNVMLSRIVWITGILALLCNLVVMWHTISKLRMARQYSNRFSPMVRSNYILVFNLATADLLMGIYLLILAIQNTTSAGSYCKVDREWRSGLTCASLGSLAMVSIQSSVLFLVLLTTFRMVALLRPFKADSLQTRYTVILVVIVWCVSLLLAFIPRFPQFKKYFVSAVWISTSVYFFDNNTPSKYDIEKFIRTIMAYYNKTQPTNDMTWEEIRSSFPKYYPEDWPKFKINDEFGFYSAHSVCLPKLFVTVEDNAWAYSISILAFDFASFAYIVASYWSIYRDVARTGAYRNDAAEENKTMQARITRLVLTDFLCLVPVCVTAFLSIAGVPIVPVAYAIAAIILLPINSAINPIIYSNILSIMYSTCIGPQRICFKKSRTKKGMKGRLQDNHSNQGRNSNSQCKDDNNSQRLTNSSSPTKSLTNMSVMTATTRV